MAHRRILLVAAALYRLKGLITQAEWRADKLLVEHGRSDVTATVHEAAHALHALAEGSTGVEAGLQSALTEILMVMHQLGASNDAGHLGETSESVAPSVPSNTNAMFV